MKEFPEIPKEWVPIPKYSFREAVPCGFWLFRVETSGWPTIFVVRVTEDPTKSGHKLIWMGGGGSRRWDPFWATYDITHYAPIEAFPEVVKEILTLG